MIERTIYERVGEACGPIDWTHSTAKDMPPIWREAEKDPGSFLLDDGGMRLRRIMAVSMYDGWPYWKPRPAILHASCPGSTEWSFFDSYCIRAGSIVRRAA